MSTESLRRVLLRLKGEAREMRKEKYASRVAPKPKEPAKASAVEKIREVLTGK